MQTTYLSHFVFAIISTTTSGGPVYERKVYLNIDPRGAAAGGTETITDIPAWLKDHSLADLEFQISPQEFIFTRADIYASNMLLLQYSIDAGQVKEEIDFTTISDSIIIILMAKAPKPFKEFKSERYIHRFEKAHSDSGLEFRMHKQLVFVELDKALEMYISGEYNEDEDVELLKLFALIADINNEKVKEECDSNRFLRDIREDVYKFTQDKEVQQMIYAEDIAMADYYSSLNGARKEERAGIIELYKWLHSKGRDEDFEKGTNDPAYLEALLDEYHAVMENRKADS